VVNFDVPLVPDDYIHRVGRTGRAQAIGEAFTFVAPEERASLLAIERAIGRPLQQVTVPDFDYQARPAAKLEVPIAERIAEIRARKADARARSAAKSARQGRPGNQMSPGPSRDRRQGAANDRRSGGFGQRRSGGR
jgi:ATP-dependent RNA helicase RhlE